MFSHPPLYPSTEVRTRVQSHDSQIRMHNLTNHSRNAHIISHVTSFNMQFFNDTVEHKPALKPLQLRTK